MTFKIASQSGGAFPGGVYAGSLIRSITSHSAGKFYFEMTIDAALVLAHVGIGVDNGGESLVLPGGQAASLVWAGDGKVNYNWLRAVYRAALLAVGGTYGVAVDITNRQIYLTPDGTVWNINGSASPAGNVGGFSIAAITGAVLAMAQMSDVNDQITANFTGSSPSFAYSAPSGFSAWG